MKTLREYIDQLDEISRRDFLKGAGAAAGLSILGKPGQAIAQAFKHYNFTDEDGETLAALLSMIYFAGIGRGLPAMSAAAKSTLKDLKSVYGLNDLYNDAFIFKLFDDMGSLQPERYKIFARLNHPQNQDVCIRMLNRARRLIDNMIQSMPPNEQPKYADQLGQTWQQGRVPRRESEEDLEEGLIGAGIGGALGLFAGPVGALFGAWIGHALQEKIKSGKAKTQDLMGQGEVYQVYFDAKNINPGKSLSYIEAFDTMSDLVKKPHDIEKYFDIVDSRTGNSVFKYRAKVDASNFMKKLAMDRREELRQEYLKQNPKVEPKMEKDLEEEATPDAVRRIEQLVQYK